MQFATSLRDLVEGAESLIYIEESSVKNGFLQSINPIVKFVVTLSMIVVSLFVPSLSYLTLMCPIPIMLSLISKISLKDFLMRTALIPLFATAISLPVLFITPGTSAFNANLGSLNFAVTFEGMQKLALFTVRVWFCVEVITLFILSTGFNAFLRILSSMRLPPILIQMFSLTYRYLFVSIHEIQKFLIAKEARTYVNRRTISLNALKNSGALLATIFIRTYDRSERVYMAMKARGFDINNTNKSSIEPVRARDFVFVASTIVILGLLIVL
jgi:cobalt/nickel transport system permease protein